MRSQLHGCRRSPVATSAIVLRGLVARLRETEGPDRDLDCQIDTAIYRIEWRPYRDDARMVWGHGPDGAVLRHGREICPAVTASLDAAQALLTRALPGWSWQVHTESRPEAGFCAAVWRSWGRTAYQRHVAEALPTPALALTFAVLTALLDDPEADDAL